MHVEIEKNELYFEFDILRQKLGFTTFKSAILQSMRLFIEQKSLEVEDNE